MLKLERPLHLAFGVIAYVVALRSMVWFVGWQVNLFLPKTIDSGPAGPFATALAVDLALLLSFGFVHSLLARRSAKRALERIVPAALERSCYSLVAGLQITALMLFWQPLPIVAWSVTTPHLRELLWALHVGGWALVAVAFWTTGNAHLFGLAQAWASSRGVGYQRRRLVARGIYRRIRHPLYTGTLVSLWAIPDASQGRALLALVFTGYTLLGALLEERDLDRDLGAPYRAYRRAVPAYLPRLRPPAPVPTAPIDRAAVAPDP